MGIRVISVKLLGAGDVQPELHRSCSVSGFDPHLINRRVKTLPLFDQFGRRLKRNLGNGLGPFRRRMREDGKIGAVRLSDLFQGAEPVEVVVLLDLELRRTELDEMQLLAVPEDVLRVDIAMVEALCAENLKGLFKFLPGLFRDSLTLGEA